MTEIKDTSGLAVYRIYGNEVKDTSGLAVYRIYGNEVKDTSGSTVYRIYPDVQRDTTGSTYADLQCNTIDATKNKEVAEIFQVDSKYSGAYETYDDSFNEYVADINRMEKRMEKRMEEERLVKEYSKKRLSPAVVKSLRICSLILLLVSGALFALMYFKNFPFLMGSAILGSLFFFLVSYSGWIEESPGVGLCVVAAIGGAIFGLIAGFVLQMVVGRYEFFNEDINRMISWCITTVVLCVFFIFGASE